jgi:hypothetical protein
LLAAISVKGQQRKIQNLERFDRKKFHFGFALGVNSAAFIMDYDPSKVDSLKLLDQKRETGFNLGIVSDLHIHPLFNLRFIPTLSFAQRNLNYTFYDSRDSAFVNFTKPVESTFIDFPLLFKFRSMRQNNFAAYFVGGGKFSYDLAANKKVDNIHAPRDEVVVKIETISYSYEVGFGMDFFLEYFKFSPEIKWTFGINNLIINDGTEFSAPITKLKHNIFTISFTFEG